jgi:molybdopterin-guanine dinucleotide biosynthesis protein A
MTGAQRTTVVLLAGGSATRLPGKLLLPVDGEPMAVRAYRRLSHGGRPLIVSARGPLPPELAAVITAPLVIDEFEDAGPLGGMVSAAAHVSTPLLFAAAGDLPQMDAAFIDALETAYDRVAASGTPPEAVVPRWPDGKDEPLAALYEARALERAGRAALAAGTRKVMAALAGLRLASYAVRAEDEAKLANVNTSADYEAHRRS